MRKIALSILLAALLAWPASGPVLAAGQGVEKVAWLAGCWQGDFGDPGTIEQWTAPAGGTMLGVSRTVKGASTVEFEFMQLRQLQDGTLAFIAQPAGRAPTEFRALRLSESEVIFENPAHDFPRRISYSRPTGSKLLAVLDGVGNGAARKVELSFSRVSCDIPLVQTQPLAQSPPSSCANAEHRAFDFWIGEWNVYGANGKLAGTNSISREIGGCVIHERYDTGRGYSGESFNVYDAPRKVWHQTWVDSSGLLLLLEGGIQDGKMILEGQTLGTDQKSTRHRITWTPSPDGSVQQLWESTGPSGEWTVAFDGKYTRK